METSHHQLSFAFPIHWFASVWRLLAALGYSSFSCSLSSFWISSHMTNENTQTLPHEIHDALICWGWAIVGRPSLEGPARSHPFRKRCVRAYFMWPCSVLCFSLCFILHSSTFGYIFCLPVSFFFQYHCHARGPASFSWQSFHGRFKVYCEEFVILHWIAKIIEVFAFIPSHHRQVNRVDYQRKPVT